MSNFTSIISAAYSIMNIQFTLYGFTLTFWKVMLWSTVAGILISLIVRFLRNE